MKIGKISTAQLFSTKKITLGMVALGLYFIVVSLMMGTVDYPTLILGLTLAGCALINAHDKPLVISGILVGFMGLANLLAIGNVLPINTAWIITAVCAVGVGILELTGFKFGKASKQAKDAAVIPLFSLFAMFILALVGINPALYVDLSLAPMKFLNYVALMVFTGLLSFRFLGWRLVKKNEGMWIAVLALLCIVTSFVGVYQGTLAW